MGASFYPSAFSWAENIVFLRGKRCFHYWKRKYLVSILLSNKLLSVTDVESLVHCRL